MLFFATNMAIDIVSAVAAQLSPRYAYMAPLMVISENKFDVMAHFKAEWP